MGSVSERNWCNPGDQQNETNQNGFSLNMRLRSMFPGHKLYSSVLVRPIGYEMKKTASSTELIKILGFLVSSLLMLSANAADVRYLTYAGRIVDDSGNPVNANVQFNIQLTDALGTCVIWEETLADSVVNGVFSLQIGRGTNVFDGFGTGSLEGIFQQGLAVNCKGGVPSASKTPSITEDRNMIVSFDDGTGWQTVASQIPIRSVPYALYSENVAKLVGYPIAVTVAPSNGQVLQFQSGSGTWVPTTLSAGGAVAAGTAAAPGYSFTGNTNTGIFSPAANQVAVSANGVEVVRVDATGKVGIGTSAPSSVLHVKENSGTQGFVQANIEQAGSGDAGMSFVKASVRRWTIGMDSSDSYKLKFASTTASTPSFATDTKMTIDNSGNVGIGTSSPNANSKLEVVGASTSRTNIIATGAAVDLSKANQHFLKAPGSAAITLQNPADGGVYTLMIFDTTSRTYTFSGCTDSFFSPTNGPTSNYTTYTVMVAVDGGSTHCFITWITGFN